MNFRKSSLFRENRGRSSKFNAATAAAGVQRCAAVTVRGRRTRKEAKEEEVFAGHLALRFREAPPQRRRLIANSHTPTPRCGGA